jgi:hypothetical protein
MRMLAGQMTTNKDDTIQSRYKTGVFSFIGGISKILFGTLDKMKITIINILTV